METTTKTDNSRVSPPVDLYTLALVVNALSRGYGLQSRPLANEEIENLLSSVFRQNHNTDRTNLEKKFSFLADRCGPAVIRFKCLHPGTEFDLVWGLP